MYKSIKDIIQQMKKVKYLSAKMKLIIHIHSENICMICKRKGERDIWGWIKDKTTKNLFEIDHIIPVSKDGNNDFSNLRILCRRCNRAKNNRNIFNIRYINKKGQWEKISYTQLKYRNNKEFIKYSNTNLLWILL